jgi:hypothetical protein
MQVKSQPSIGRVHIYRRGGLRWPSRNTSNVSNTMPDTHLLKKVIQAETLGCIDNQASCPVLVRQSYPERTLWIKPFVSR